MLDLLRNHINDFLVPQLISLFKGIMTQEYEMLVIRVHTALDLTSATFFFFFCTPSSTPFVADFLFFSNSFFFFLLSSYSAIRSGQSRLLSGSQVFSELQINNLAIHEKLLVCCAIIDIFFFHFDCMSA